MDHREVAEHVARRLGEEAGDVVERVILFGSVARGEQTDESDVDLVVVARDYERVLHALRVIRGELYDRDAPSLSAMIFTSEQFAEFPRLHTPFHEDVLTAGEALLA